MNAGYYRSEYDAAYINLLAQQAILNKATPEEKATLKDLYLRATHSAGKDHNQFVSQQTTDKGIEESASLMSQYRILLANIKHRGTTNGSGPKSST